MSALSVVVVIFNIPREAPRTLFSLSADYQDGIDADDCEVLVIDNGSTPPRAIARQLPPDQNRQRRADRRRAAWHAGREHIASLGD